MRSGTLPTHQIVGMGEAFALAMNEMAAENARILALRNRLLNGLKAIPAMSVNGDLEQRVLGNLNISFGYVEGESLMLALKDLEISSGSACTSAVSSRPTSCEPSACQMNLRTVRCESLSDASAQKRRLTMRWQSLGRRWQKLRRAPRNGWPRILRPDKPITAGLLRQRSGSVLIA